MRTPARAGQACEPRATDSEEGTMSLFRNRREAGRRLAAELARFAGQDDLVVLALPRGGVPVAFEVATALRAAMDVLVVRKLGVPGHEELAMGAIAPGGTIVLNDGLVRELDIPQEKVDEIALREGRELERRERAYRGTRPPTALRDRTVIVVDDGLATGATMRAAVTAVRERSPAWLVVAVPTAAQETCDEMAEHVDEVVCAETPAPFLGVGMWYEDFSQTTDDEVKGLLAELHRAQAS